MYREAECCKYVVVHEKNVDMNEQIPGSLIVTHLLKQLSFCKATEEYGYFLGVTNLKSIGNGRKLDKYFLFPVVFCCRTLLPVNGEVMVGVVDTIYRSGVRLKCGPANDVYLSARKMPNYIYVPGEKPLFLSNDFSRIEKDVAIRFVVFSTRWSPKSREIRVLASLEGDCLGPVSLASSSDGD